MNKCFNNVQMFKSSEVCDKFSKSVSYETLVGGTTTIGRERKQKGSSLILRKAKFQAIFEFVLSYASGGAGGGKYILNLIICYPVKKELIRRCLEKFLLS